MISQRTCKAVDQPCGEALDVGETAGVGVTAKRDVAVGPDNVKRWPRRVPGEGIANRRDKPDTAIEPDQRSEIKLPDVGSSETAGLGS